MFNRFLQPENFFLYFSSLLGIVFLFLTPPFQVPDEQWHFYRTYQVSNFTFKGEKKESASGGMLPSSLERYVALVMDGIPFHPEKKLDRTAFKQSFHLELNPKTSMFLNFPNPVLYFPTQYFPQALGVGLAKILNLKLPFLFYLGRISNLVFSIILLFFAIKLIPFFKWGMLLIALSPMSVFLRSSLSADVFIQSSCLLLIALSFKIAMDKKWQSPKHILFWCVIAYVTSLSKQAYFFLIFLFFIFPNKNKTTWIYFFILLLLSAITHLAWSSIVKKLYVPTVAGSNLELQMKHFLANPISVTWMIAKTLFNDRKHLFAQMFGKLGWLDTDLPRGLQNLYINSALVCLIEQGSLREKIKYWQRSLALFLFLSSCLWIGLLLYLTGIPVGEYVLYGVQGRYFLPIIPLLFIPFSFQGTNFKLKFQDTFFKVYIPLLLILTHTKTFFVLIERYWKTY